MGKAERRAAAAVLELRARRPNGGALPTASALKLPDPTESDLAFVQHYNLKIDKKPFQFDGYFGYRHLVGVFLDDHPDLVAMAGAQTGKSARLMARLARAALQHPGSLFGYYFPDLHLPAAFSRERFAPFILSSKELGAWLGRDEVGDAGTDQIFTRSLAGTTLYFLSVKGKSMTEGLPMKGVFFDELRRMEAGDIERAEERISAQDDPLNVKVSTARYRDQDIHAAFMAGDQRWFHTACSCPDGVVLAEVFPNCIADLRNASPELLRKVDHAFTSSGAPYLGATQKQLRRYPPAAYVCPRCGDIITDPRDGWWEAREERAWVHSYQMPQLLSPAFPASRALWKFEKSKDLQEVWNSLVGVPYLDLQAQPVQLEHLMSCVDESLVWAATLSDRDLRRTVRNTAMGVDAMGGFNCCVIKELSPSGKYRTIHVEVVHGDDPWKQTARLMERFDVRICVADCNPHWNEAHRFAKAFEGRVWLAVYVDTPRAPMIDWKDRAKAAEGQRKSGEDVRFKFMVNLSRTRALSWSLGRWKRRLNETPSPTGLVAYLPRQGGKVVLTAGLRVGRMEPVAICRDVYWVHQMSVAFRKIYASEEAERRDAFRVVAEHVGLDPHFAHADLYADVALARMGKPATPRRGGE